ncbi:histone-lysine N-methyltransferase SETD1A [Hetaerina americana]|uniref:histone-lysine N-methyltransferase SETD1A n=1 Tax=Hetaerina americana TaxID=62018 RepID=UPI003A7F1988
MARAGMAKWRQGGGRGAPSSLTEGGDEVQRSLELLDRVLSEFDDLENGNIEGAGPGVVAPGIAQAAKVHPPPPSAAPPGGVGPQGPVVPPVPDRLPSGGGAAGGGSTPEDEEEEEDRSHQSEDDGYMSMNGRRMAPRPPAPRDEVQAPEVSGGEAGGRRAGDKVGRPPPNEDTPPPIPPLPSAAAPRSPPLPPLPPAAAQAGLALEDEDFPPPPEEAERIISTLLPRVTPGGGSGRHRGSGRGRLAGGWGSLGPPVGSPRPGLADLDPEMVAGCLVTTATQTTLPQTKHQRPYGWNVPFQPHPNATESVISAAVDIQKQRRRQHTAEGKPPPLPPLRFGSLPLDSRPVPPAPLPPRTLPGAGERHRVVRRRDEAHLQPTSTTALFEDGAPEARRRRGPGAADEEAFSDDSLEEAPRLAPPSPSASSTSPPGSDDGKRRSVAWEVSLEELDALAEEEGGGERACGSSEVAEMVPGSTKVVRGRSSRSRRSSSSDRSLGSSEPRSMDDRCGSWRGRRSASSASVGLHLSSNEEEYSGSGLEGGGEAAAELDEMATAADMAMLDDVEMTMATSQEGRGGPKGTYVIRKRRGRAGLGKADDKREDEEAKVAKNSLPGSPPTGDVSPTPECSLNSSPENEDKAPRVTPAPKTPERLPTTRPPKYFHGSRIPVLENSRIPILESSRALECRSPRSPRTPERASPMKNVIYLSGVQSRSPTSETSVTSAIEPHQVVVKITESGSSSMVMTGELEVRSPPPSPAHGANRPAELPELRKNSRPNTPFDRTPERRNAAGKLPPAPPPRTVTAQSVSKSSPSAVEPPETPPRTTPNAGVSSADEVGSRMCSFEASPAPPAPPNGLTETSSFEATPPPGEKTCTADALRETAVTVPVTPGEGQQSVEESGSPEAAPAPVQSPASEKKDRALKSPAPAVPRKNPAPQPPPRPLPRVLSLPAIAIGLTCDEEVEAIEESGVVEVAAEKMESVLEVRSRVELDKAVEEEYKKRVEAPKMEGEACVEAREERAEEATPVKEVVEELAIKEVEVEWTKKAAVLPAPPTASPPETPVFSPRRGAPAADVPRRGHLYQRRGEPNGEACSMRHPSGAMTAGPASGHCSGYSLCGTAVSSTSSTASSSPFPGGLGPGRGWYPRHRHHAGAQQAATTTTAHHQHPAHNRPRPASTEHLDRLATASGPTAWDLHGYGPARAVVGGGAAALSGMCGPGVGARKPLTLPPNLTPKFFHRSPREALRRVTSLLIRKGSATKEAGRRDGAAGASGSVGVTSPTAAGPSSPPPAAAPGGSPDGTRTKRGFFKSFWKRSRHYSLEHQ